MVDHFESTAEAPPTALDTKGASTALSNEANAANPPSNPANPSNPSNSSKASDTKSSDTTSDKHLDLMFGPLSIVDVDASAQKTIQGDAQVAAARKHLNADIAKEEKGLDPKSDQYTQLEQMKLNMQVFEARSAAEHPPLTAAEIARTYKEISHLIHTKDGPDVQLKHSDRVAVAQQIMMHAADPTTIDQGQHLTCNVTTVEARMFAKNPAAAVSLIDQVATTGQYHPTDNPSDTIKIDPGSLLRHPGNGEESHTVPPDGGRSYASQIFQVTAVNAYYHSNCLEVKNDKGETVTYLPGAVEYRQGEPDANATPPLSGETLYDVSTSPAQPIKDGKDIVHCPNLMDDHIFQVYNIISDRPETEFMVFNKDYVAGEGKYVTRIDSEDDLKQKILDAQKNGKLPIILGVNSGQEPFFSDSHGGAAGGAGGSHVVSVTGMDKDGNVMVNNQWGKASKHAVDLHELYVATLHPADAIAVLKRDCAKNAQAHKVNFATEAELLRLRHASGDLQSNDHEYIDQLTWLTKAAVADAVAHHDGELDDRTELELHSQLEVERKAKGKDWDWIKDQIWAGPLAGIMDGSGLLLDDNAKEIVLTPDYATRQMDYAAKNIYDAGDATVYFDKDDYQKLDKALADKSPAQMQQIDQLFKEKHGKTIEEYIKDRFKWHPEERDKALKLLHRAEQGDDQVAA
jgi:hypothetical protein